jgi:hypothetical protein
LAPLWPTAIIFQSAEEREADQSGVRPPHSKELSFPNLIRFYQS